MTDEPSPTIDQLSHAVRERVKELHALHSLSRTLLRTVSPDLEHMLRTVAEVLPPAFQWPDITAARVSVDDVLVSTAGFVETGPCIAARWCTHDGGDGFIEVCLTAEPPKGTGPFLEEEQALLDSVADLLRIAADRLRVEREGRDRERALRSSEERLQVAVDAARLGIIEWDFGTERATISPTTASIFGFAAGTTSVTNLEFRARIHPDDREAVRHAFLAERLGGPNRDLEYRLQMEDGSSRWVAVRGRVFFGADGVATHRVSVIADTTQQHALEQQVRHAQKMDAIGSLAGGVAHDFNNLLTVIGAAAEFAQAETQPGSQAHSDVSDILDTVGRAHALTSQLLAFSRRQVVRLARVHVNDVVLDAQKLLARLLGGDIALQLSTAAALPPVLGDVTQLEQVLINLVVNARDAMPEGGCIEIVTALRVDDEALVQAHPDCAEKEFVVLEVRDSGAGMDESTRSRIFEPFFTTKESGRGTGLGLATVFGIVKQAGGQILVNTELGVGTTFRVFLPVAPRSVTETPASGMPAVGAMGGDETVLLVEDDAHVRLLTRRMLAERGYSVLEAASAQEALRIASEHPGSIHLLLTDVVLPEHNGRELADAFALSHPDTRVLFMSGYTADAGLHARLSEPGTTCLDKPFTRATLAAAVRITLDRPAFA